MPPGYEFVRVLGTGGFGEVVLARHLRLNRMVAIKRIHEYGLSDEESLQRFEREAKVLASTHSAAVVRVYDLSRFEGHVQLVMEYVPGQPLSDLLELGPLPATEALVILRDVADALGAAAQRGVVHRDIKPANVFVLPDGHAKLGDFGLARIVSDSSVFRTSGGVAMGTPAYFPPELSQSGSEPDELSDAYSFAVMAYETLTGRRPYEGTDELSLLTAHWRLSPPDPADVLPGFPERGSRWLLRGLEKDPAARPLPLALVAGLSSVPDGEWPAVVRAEASTAVTNRSAPTRRVYAPAAPVVTTGRSARRKRGPRRRVYVAAAVLAAAACSAAGVRFMLADDGSRLRVETVAVTTDPASGRLTCPGGDFTFSGLIRTNGGEGDIELRWTRPDGGSTKPRTISVASGQTQVLAKLVIHLQGRRPFTGPGVLQVLKPDARRAQAPMSYECTG